MHHTTTGVAAALLLVVSSLPAMAEYDSAQIYLFGNVGQSSADMGSSKRTLDQLMVDGFGAAGLSSSVDEDDTAYKLGLGMQLNRYFALEGTWVDLGNFAYRGVTNGGSLKVDIESRGFGGSLVGRLPFDDYGLSLYAKVGWHALKTEASVKAVAARSSSISADETESVGSWGIGVAWEFAPQFSVIGEFERYLDVGSDDVTGGDADVDFWSLGLRYDLL